MARAAHSLFVATARRGAVQVFFAVLDGRRLERSKMRPQWIGIALYALLMASLPATAQPAGDRQARHVASLMDQAFEEGWARSFMQAMPKGGDLHNHLQGAIYAETWLEWAAEDGLCVDVKRMSLVVPEQSGVCQDGLQQPQAVLENKDNRRILINALSIRDFVPTPGFSGADQFFATFFRMANRGDRFGDMLAAVAARAGHQNIPYLELMHTIVLPQLFPLAGGVTLSGDAAKDLDVIMAASFGAQRQALADYITAQIDKAYARKDALLGCATTTPQKGCEVKINLLHQVVREFEPSIVYAQIALGWTVMQQDSRVVGLNLVAPEHGYFALRDYTQHMEMIDHLYKSEGAQNITLHAGELALGQVRPKNLRFHIRSAIEIGHARRIGHGTAIAFEDDSEGLLNLMREAGIPVEINITSSDAILGIRGRDHPVHLYRRFGVPVVFSTDDEGVGRIDLTHELMRAVTDFGIGYFELKQAARDSIRYSFIAGVPLASLPSCEDRVRRGQEPDETCLAFMAESEKAAMEWALEERFHAFERDMRAPPAQTTILN